MRKINEEIVECFVIGIFFAVLAFIMIDLIVHFPAPALHERVYCKEEVCEILVEDTIEKVRQNVYSVDKLENKFVVSAGRRGGAGGLGAPQISVSSAKEFLSRTSIDVPVSFSLWKDDKYSSKVIKTYWGLISKNDPRLVVYEREYSCNCADYCEFEGVFTSVFGPLSAMPVIEDDGRVICQTRHFVR